MTSLQNHDKVIYLMSQWSYCWLNVRHHLKYLHMKQRLKPETFTCLNVETLWFKALEGEEQFCFNYI